MVLIVVPSKRIDLLLGVLERRKPVHVQTLLSEPAIERLDRGIVRRFAPATEVQDHAVGVRPQIHHRADELRPIVAVDPLRQPAREPQALERRRHVLAAEPPTQ